VEERLEKWLTRSVVLSLIPIGLNALFTIARGKLPWPPSMLIGNGELLLLAVGIAATAIYDLSTKTCVKDVSGGDHVYQLLRW